MNEKVVTCNNYKDLSELITDFCGSDCSFITNTQEYQDLDQKFKSFFDANFSYSKIQKLYYNTFIYKNYVIKLAPFKYPLEIPKVPELVTYYYRDNITFHSKGKNFYLGIEIQDYLQPCIKISIKQLYSLYASLRDKGYIWMDASIGNAVVYQNKPIIIDLDYIYPIDQAIYTNQSKLAKEFEKRYQQEKET